jgi:hypothetical protein
MSDVSQQRLRQTTKIPVIVVDFQREKETWDSPNMKHSAVTHSEFTVNEITRYYEIPLSLSKDTAELQGSIVHIKEESKRCPH